MPAEFTTDRELALVLPELDDAQAIVLVLSIQNGNVPNNAAVKHRLVIGQVSAARPSVGKTHSISLADNGTF